MNFDASLYDDFGNYIGSSQAEKGLLEEDDIHPVSDQLEHVQKSEARIVLHEDKKYYLAASEVYGRGVETLVQDEDTQPLSEPIIAPIRARRFQLVEPRVPRFRHAGRDFLAVLTGMPERMCTVAVVGHLHHGKTSLLDMLIREAVLDFPPQARVQSSSVGPTAKGSYDPETGIGGGTAHRHRVASDLVRYTDSLFVEHERGISLKCKAISLPLSDTKGTTRLFHFVDTPGHLDFLDEVVAGVHVADQAILLVDAVEGVMPQTEIVFKCLLSTRKPILLVINKLDRLIVELKLPPADAYHKLRHTIESLNTIAHSATSSIFFAPETGNVIFASTLYGISFSLESFARLFRSRINGRFDATQLAPRLWGDIHYDSEAGKFSHTKAGSKRTFVSFVLEPLYKLFTQVLGEERLQLERTLKSIGIRLQPVDFLLDVKPLLRCILQEFFGPPLSLIDCLSSTGGTAASINADRAALNAFVTKMHPTGDASTFDALTRIYAGSLRKDDLLCVRNGDQLGECRVEQIYLSGAGRFRIELDEAGPGMLVLLSGLDQLVSKTAFLCSVDAAANIGANGIAEATVDDGRHAAVLNQPALKVSIEPINPSDLPKMLEGLRRLSQSFPALQTRVEDSGEHVLTGCGELYLDCALHDLRRLYTPPGTDIKVADPVVRFNETVIEASYLKCWADTPNCRNRLTMLAEPLGDAVATAIEAGLFALVDGKEIENRLMSLGWDKLAARSVWALGPDPVYGPNVLLNDTLPAETDQSRLALVRDAVIQGFRWACREGPLAEEPMRHVLFRLVNVLVAEEPAHRLSGQLIPTARRVCYSAFLTAAPRLMEPVLAVFVQCPRDCAEIVYGLLAKRRGHVIQDAPISGTPIYSIRALLPVLDSVGFETDVRVNTQGAASCQSLFSHWQVVPGDPLDRSIRIVPLEPSPAPMLARDCILKTRRRKGLAEDVSPNKFFDEGMMEALH